MGPSRDEAALKLLSDFSDVAAGDEFLRWIELTPEVWRTRPHHFPLWLARKLSGLTQKQLAHKAGVDQSLVARVERGRDVRLSTMKRLYEALGYRMLIVPLKAPPEAMPWPAYSPVLKRQ